MSQSFVHIEWVDSRSIDGWTLEDDIEAILSPIQTRGWVVTENTEAVVVAGSRSPETEQYTSLIVIPKSCIKSYYNLVENYKKTNG